MEKATENPTDFLARSTFLVGFLAALIGMAAFKDELSAVHLSFFHWNISLLFIAAPMVTMMLFAAYIGALAHFLSSVNTINVPFSKYLSVTSTAVTILSLLYPIIVGLLFVFSSIAFSIRISPDSARLLSVILSGLVGSGAFILSLKASSRLFSVRTLDELLQLTTNTDITTTKHASSPDKFVSQYAQLSYFLAAYMKIKGYGTSRKGLAIPAQILEKLNTYTASDAQKAVALDTLYDAYIKGKLQPNSKEIAAAIADIHTLYGKVEQAVKLQRIRRK